MSAYIVFLRERMRDQAEFDQYTKLVPGTMAGHEPKVLAVYGKSVGLEGAPIDGCVIVEFPSIEAAQAWYDSPAYQKAHEHRLKASDYRVFITQGV